jgi:hypothetical protein
MYWAHALAVAGGATLAVAHASQPGMPLVAGDRRLVNEILGARSSRIPADNHNHGSRQEPTLNARQQVEIERCGEDVGNCAEGDCCSESGWCGRGKDYCKAPNCQLEFGSGCDGNQSPSGDDTSDIERPKVGSVPYGGAGVYKCKNRGDVAITFDDGPYDFTGDLLDKLKRYEAKATFFLTGNNLGKGMIDDPSKPWAEMIQVGGYLYSCGERHY